MNSADIGLPIEQFIQALTSQLDRAQAALALKARAGLPLTFAVKDLTLDLRTHVEVHGSVVRIRPALPNERDASTIRLQFTTVTRPMIEENTYQSAVVPNEPSLREVLGSDLSEDEQRRLEWAGIQNVAQFRDLERHSGEAALEKFTQVPAARLRAALARASSPRIVRVTAERLPRPGSGGQAPSPGGPSGPGVRPDEVRAGISKPSFVPPGATAPVAEPPLIKIRGNNLFRDRPPRVTIRGERVPVIQASENEILVAPHAHLLSGTLALEVEPGVGTEFELHLAPEGEREDAV